jgi:hypothetical protein
MTNKSQPPFFAVSRMPSAVVPLNMLSGSTTPLESMPPMPRTIMQALPSTHFLAFAQAILYRGAGIELVRSRFPAVRLIGGFQKRVVAVEPDNRAQIVSDKRSLTIPPHATE